MAGYIQNQGTGVLVPDTASVLSDVQTEYKNTFGQDLDLNSDTPQGILISVEATARTAVIKNNAEVANQINPNIANKVFLDSVCGLMDIKRSKNTSSTFSGIEITGDAGTLIKQGSRCRTPDGDVVRLSSDVTIPVSGTTSGVFVSQAYGNTNMGPVDTPWTIVDGTIGWGTAVPRSTSVQTPGTIEQTDNQLRNYRKNTLANQGRQSVRAIKGRLYGSVSGLLSASIRENYTKNAPVTIDGVNFQLPNAIWVCVDGGSDTDVVSALMEGKSCGAAWDAGSGNGTPTTVQFVEPASGQTYPVTFTRGSSVTLHCRAYVRQLYAVDNPQTACQDAILSWAAGEHMNEPGLVLGANFSAFSVAGAISVDVPGMYVRKAEVSTDGITWSEEIPMALWQKGTLPRGNITIVLEG